MKLIMTLLVRDESDILAANIEYHLAQGVDFIVAMDNLSVDSTTEILRRYEALGLLHYVHQPEDNYAQSRWVTAMAQLACTRFGADWVINNDADEFWWPLEGDLKRVLERLAPGCDAVIAARSNFLPDPQSGEPFFASRMALRDRCSVNSLGAELPAKVSHRAFADIEVEQGNHRVRRNGVEIIPSESPIEILHFPMRSYTHFANKIAKGGAAYARNGELSPRVGTTWRKLYSDLLQGDLERFYRSQMPRADEIGQGRRYVADTRLRDYLAKLQSRDALRE